MTHAATLAGIGRDLFGDEWVGPMSQLAGVNRKTVARVKQADGDGREYAAALGVLFALEERLAGVAAALNGHLPQNRR